MSKTPVVGSAGEVLAAFLKLGLISFGGPIAHLGYFRAEFVERRRWLSEQAFVDLIALAQFLPGPASSQTGFAIGLMRAGYAGGAAAWAGFTAPSAVLMTLFAWGAGSLADTGWGVGLLHGLKLVAVAIVAQAVMGMARALCPDRARASIALVAIFVYLMLAGSLGQIVGILLGGAAGLLFCRGATAPDATAMPIQVSRNAALAFLALFFALLALTFLPTGRTPLALFDAFYRSGALVFGGGHVVLPLLQQATVANGWISASDFLAGYGAAQAVPGPLFTFASYLGWIMSPAPHHWVGMLCATAGIFLPGLLLVIAVLPHWQVLRARRAVAALLAGANAAVVGLLASAFYSPVWTSAVLSATDFAVAVVALLLLTRWRVRPLLVVLFCAAAGLAEALLHA